MENFFEFLRHYMIQNTHLNSTLIHGTDDDVSHILREYIEKYQIDLNMNFVDYIYLSISRYMKINNLTLFILIAFK